MLHLGSLERVHEEIVVHTRASALRDSDHNVRFETIVDPIRDATTNRTAFVFKRRKHILEFLPFFECGLNAVPQFVQNTQQTNKLLKKIGQEKALTYG